MLNQNFLIQVVRVLRICMQFDLSFKSYSLLNHHHIHNWKSSFDPIFQLVFDLEPSSLVCFSTCLSVWMIRADFSLENCRLVPFWLGGLSLCSYSCFQCNKYYCRSFRFLNSQILLTRTVWWLQWLTLAILFCLSFHLFQIAWFQMLDSSSRLKHCLVVMDFLY